MKKKMMFRSTEIWRRIFW